MAVTIANIKDRIGADRYNTYLYDSSTSGAKTADQIAQIILDDTVIFIKSKAIGAGKTFDDAGVTDTSKITNQAIILYAISQIYAYTNTELVGNDEKKRAYELLSTIYGDSVFDGEVESTRTIEKPIIPCFSVKNSTGKKLDVNDRNFNGYTNDYILTNQNSGLYQDESI